MHSWNGCPSAELANRFRVKQGWLELGGFWFSSSEFKIKRELFIGKIVEAAHSGGTAFCFSRAQYGQLDAKISGLLRSLLRGGASVNDSESGKYKWSNLKVFRRWRFLPAATEAALRRVKLLQAMVEMQAVHAQSQGVLFGDLFEHGTLDSCGRIVGGSLYAATFQAA